MTDSDHHGPTTPPPGQPHGLVNLNLTKFEEDSETPAAIHYSYTVTASSAWTRRFDLKLLNPRVAFTHTEETFLATPHWHAMGGPHPTLLQVRFQLKDSRMGRSEYCFY